MIFNMQMAMIAAGGLLVGVFASFSGLGGGFIMVPLLLFLGNPAPKAVGTSLLAVMIISASALFAHHRLGNVDVQTGLFLGFGGLVGAQLGARMVENLSTSDFQKIFALLLFSLSLYLFFKK